MFMDIFKELITTKEFIIIFIVMLIIFPIIFSVASKSKKQTVIKKVPKRMDSTE